MGYSEITTGKEARERVFEGLEEIAMVVAETLGPKGKNVIIDNLLAEPTVTNDGITCVRGISFKDHYKNIAAFMLKKTCDRTNKIAGDGTSTTTILAYAIVKEGMKYIENGVSPFHLAKALNEYKSKVIGYLKDNATNLSGSDDIKKIATISSQDEEVGSLIADAYGLVGDRGTVIVEESTDRGMTIEHKAGLEFDEQLKSQYLITNSERLQCELENAFVFVTDKKFLSLMSIKVVIDQIIASGISKDLLFVCDDIDQGALNNFIINHQKGIFKVAVVKAPSYGEKKEAFFQDICAITSATLVSEKTGLDFEKVTLAHLGMAEKVISGRQSTLISGGKYNEEMIDKIVEGLDQEIKRAELDEWTKSRAELRRARLVGGIAAIKIGFPTEVETKNKVMKVEDAINATKAAVQEGVIYGAGVSLIEASQMCSFGKTDISLFQKLFGKKKYDEEVIAEKIMKTAMRYPTKLIFDNAGENGNKVVKAIMESEEFGIGFDINDMEVKDLVSIGVIDPVMVIRVALENAVSMANMILTSNVVVTDEEEFDDQDVSA